VEFGATKDMQHDMNNRLLLLLDPISAKMPTLSGNQVMDHVPGIRSLWGTGANQLHFKPEDAMRAMDHAHRYSAHTHT